MEKQKAAAIAAEIIMLYQQHGGKEYAGEKLSQTEHMLQAAMLARQQGYDDEVVLAAFLHDIGHICEAAAANNHMDGWGIKDHEEIGALYLKEKGFTDRLCKLVSSHVAAKRYLTLKEPGYYESLSEASKQTLAYQGGRMNEAEAIAFENDELFNLMITMRRWDEAAKIEGMPLQDVTHYEQLLTHYLIKQNK
ncbi:MAG: HD domain-containing protein [Flavihumibacter sp.]|nr:HD domain-containing protein [Flavihumibacter sp.]